MRCNVKISIRLLVNLIISAHITVHLSSCEKENPDPQPPTITLFEPSSGLVGTAVAIKGTNFSATDTGNAVSFNGTPAAITSSSNAVITAVVPINATSGKITVRVNGQMATSVNDFTVLSPPTLTSFSPQYGVPGASISIFGTNFSTLASNHVVTINNLGASVIEATPTQLIVVIPTAASTGKIAITVNGITITSNTDFEVLKDIPRAGLVAFYPFTGNGACQNNSDLNLPVASAGQPTLVADRFGKSNQALNFVGDQFAQIDKNLLPNRPWTISVWLNPGQFNNTLMGLMSFYQSYGLALRLENAGSGDFYIQGVGKVSLSDPFYSMVNSQPLTRYIPGNGTEDKWFLITMTYNGTTFKVFKDNVEVHSTETATETPTPNRFTLGKSATVSVYEFIGKLDDLIIYNRVLTNLELTQVAEQTISKY